MLIDEVTDLIERTSSLAHIVVDEAQDLSAMACRAIGRRCTTGSVTVLGDIAQGTTAWAARSWGQMLRDLGKPEAELEELVTGYRVPRQILDFASRLLGEIAPGLEPARSVRQDPGALVITPVTAGGCRDAGAGVRRWARRPGSIAVITLTRAWRQRRRRWRPPGCRTPCWTERLRPASSRSCRLAWSRALSLIM